MKSSGATQLAGCFLILVLLGLMAPFLAPQDPLLTEPEIARQPPSRAHLLGTDEIGRDILARMLTGARTTLGIGCTATTLACLIGALMGLFAGYFGGKVDLIISQLIDISLAFPSLLLAIAISIVLEQGVGSVIIALMVAGWADFARLMRSQTLALKDREFILSAKALGTSDWAILFRHLLPNCMSLLVVSGSLKLGGFMLAESGLSFLGLGIPAPYPTLGGMVAGGRDYLIVHPWIPLFPGLLIAAIVLSANFLGEALQTHLDPKRNA